MAIKSYGVRFYCGQAFVENGQPVSAILAKFEEMKRAGIPFPHLQDGAVAYELRDFESFNGGASYRGVLAVLRDDAPNIRTATGGEKPIQLEVDEHVIEKNHFLYFRENELLVWQVNGRASHISRLEAYLANVAGHAVSLADVLNEQAIKRLDNGIIQRLEIRVARVRNAEAVDPNSWVGSTFDLMNGLDGTTLSIDIGTRRKKRGLSAKAMGVVHGLMARPETRSLRVKLDGQDDLIDLFADCIKDRIGVGMVGLYPVPAEIFSALAAAKDNQKGALDACFGAGSGVLD
jgi:hypothetical protein